MFPIGVSSTFVYIIINRTLLTYFQNGDEDEAEQGLVVVGELQAEEEDSLRAVALDLGVAHGVASEVDLTEDEVLPEAAVAPVDGGLEGVEVVAVDGVASVVHSQFQYYPLKTSLCCKLHLSYTVNLLLLRSDDPADVWVIIA